MVWDVCTETEPKARKDYHCQASDWIENSGLCEGDYDACDWVTIKKAKSENFRILKGEKYICVRGIWNGVASTFRARIDLDSICKKYELYDLYS